MSKKGNHRGGNKMADERDAVEFFGRIQRTVRLALTLATIRVQFFFFCLVNQPHRMSNLIFSRNLQSLK